MEQLLLGDCLEKLKELPENSVDSIVTDPPYELGFMGKSWDSTGIANNVELWKECLRVLKPGGHLLSFSGTRTYHRMAVAIEDAGFEVRDMIEWVYGCLSEDTEVLTKDGFKHFHKITQNDIIRVYDTQNDIYKWEKPQRWNQYAVEQDTAYRIKSDTTDQIVSRNHNCLVEREGKLVFVKSEDLLQMERVPVLSGDISILQEGQGELLHQELLWQGEGLVETILSERVGQEASRNGIERREEPSVERGSDLQKEKGEICRPENKVCEMPERVSVNGEKGRVCNGTQIESSTKDTKTTDKNGVCSSHQSRCNGQQDTELNAIQDERGTQEIRTRTTYKTTLATIEKIEYTGTIFCPTVSTGAFVARRNGQVFITGNSGFPKSLNVRLNIDKQCDIIKDICRKSPALIATDNFIEAPHILNGEFFAIEPVEPSLQTQEQNVKYVVKNSSKRTVKSKIQGITIAEECVRDLLKESLVDKIKGEEAQKTLLGKWLSSKETDISANFAELIENLKHTILKKLETFPNYDTNFQTECVFVINATTTESIKECLITNTADILKELNHKLHKGLGTALKPAHEPICMARKPLGQQELDIAKTICYNIRENSLINNSNILWRIKNVKNAGKQKTNQTSFSTEPQKMVEVSVKTVSELENQNLGKRIESLLEKMQGDTATITEKSLTKEVGCLTEQTKNESLPTQEHINENEKKKLLLPMEESVSVVESQDLSSSLLTTSGVAEENTEKKLKEEIYITSLKKQDTQKTDIDYSVATATSQWVCMDIVRTLKVSFEGKEYDFIELSDGSLVWNENLEPYRKQQKLNVAENCLKYGTGGINIDESRVEFGDETDNRVGTDTLAGGSKESIFGGYSNIKDKNIQMYKGNGRFPANLILSWSSDEYMLKLDVSIDDLIKLKKHYERPQDLQENMGENER